MKKIFKKPVLMAITILLLSTTIVYAKNEETKPILMEKSQIFSQWEELSEEQKSQTIQPLYFNMNIKDSIKRSTYNNLRAGVSLETRYNLRDELNKINVKNQQRTGSCWAFSYTTAIETTIANKYNKTSAEYSPMHMDYATTKIYNRVLGGGGTPYMALAYSASGKGPVYESDLPFNSVYSEENNSAEQYYLSNIENVSLNQTAKAKIEDAIIFASIYKSYSTNAVTYSDAIGNKYSGEEVSAMRQLIKKHIKENGAILAAVYSDIGIDQNGEHLSLSGSYNSETKAYYYTGNSTTNHAVTIVGWDDNFSKNNFQEGKQPLNDGAYIVLNSYGEEFGENGYFYISYDDASIEQLLCGINEVKETGGKTDYDKLYEYDELGMSSAIYSINDTKTAYLPSGYAANVFSRKNTGKKEYLSEVGIYLMSAEGVEVYVNAEDDNLDNCTLVSTSTGTSALETGYHTLKLASPVELTGDKFVVKIKYINSEIVTIPIECNLLDSGFTTESTPYDKATSNQGESFFSNTGEKWNDLYNLEIDGFVIKNTNACIKAFTTLSEASSTVATQSVKLNKNQATIEVGEKMTLQATVLPENATNKNVTWSSSNEKVATITENGIIEALSEGKTNIKVTTKDGGFESVCELTVTEKATNDDDIYTEKGETPGKIQQVQSIDTTIAQKELPNAGMTTIIVIIIGISIVTIIIFIKNKKYKDIN